MLHDSPSANMILKELENINREAFNGFLVRGHDTHCAGMARKYRLIVEGLFKERQIKALVSTRNISIGCESSILWSCFQRTIFLFSRERLLG